MKKQIRFIAVLTLTAVVAASLRLSPAYAAENQTFSDVPAGSWAAPAIESAVGSGLMNGVGNGRFGYGKTITRAEFVTVLCNMFGWDKSKPDKPTFTDVKSGDWFFGYVEAAAARGLAGGGAFAPNAPILRKDMAVMLVKALGYDALASMVDAKTLPFSDVTSDAGYITIACDIGMTGGVGGGRFAPDNTAKREEAAAMLTRVYAKMTAPLAWLHGFYAFSSYNQKDMIKSLNAVTFGWSAMSWDARNGAVLNTTASGGNPWNIPASYEAIAGAPRENGAGASLGVYMDTSMGLGGLLADEKSQNDAAGAILNEATRAYDALGRSPYDGVTVDFEGLKGADAKAQFVAFLTKLSAALKSRGLALYVTVQPATANGISGHDGYDYRAIGRLADKVILMAHDYQPASMAGLLGSDWQKNAALTPIADVYAALKAITDPDTGVEDKGKIALGLSFSCVGWMIDAGGKLVSPDPVNPSADTVYSRMNQPDTVKSWSDAYQNPYMTYTIENGDRVYLWYEDGRSVSEKLRLARLFGVTGASVWRLGIIPNYPGWSAWPIGGQ